MTYVKCQEMHLDRQHQTLECFSSFLRHYMPFCIHTKLYADAGGLAISDVDLRPLGCWDRGFTSR